MDFALYGKEGAVSRVHTDAEGALTAILIVCGAKLWLVRTTKTHQDDPSLDLSKTWNSQDWDAGFADEGDIMYARTFLLTYNHTHQATF
jgi:hypothetical protein